MSYFLSGGLKLFTEKLLKAEKKKGLRIHQSKTVSQSVIRKTVSSSVQEEKMEKTTRVPDKSERFPAAHAFEKNVCGILIVVAIFYVVILRTDLGIMNILGCFVLGLFAWAFCVWATTMYRLRTFTGPLSIPILGNLYDVRAIAVMKYLTHAAQKYGNTFLFWPGNKAMLVVMESSDVRQILTDTKTFIKGNDYTQKFSIAFGDGLVTSNGSVHRHDRACLSKYFLRGSIETRLQMICSETKKAMGEILDAHTTKSTEGLDVSFPSY